VKSLEGSRELRFEIIAGQRRSEAATILGLGAVPCIVRELTDAEAADIALIDNLQRADVPALEEAEAFDELLGRYLSVTAVALKVGKDVAHVAQRLKLCSLTAWSREALRGKLITVEHALLLARLGEEEQNAALKWCLDRNAGSKTSVEKVISERVARFKQKDEEDDDDLEDEPGRPSSWNHIWEPESVQRLRQHIAGESGQPLDRAPWDLDEPLLIPDAPACAVCPQNTKANLPLFGDLGIAAPICTDGGCFKQKTAKFVEIKTQLAAKLGRKSVGDIQVLRLSWKLTSTVPRQLKDGGGVNPAQIFKQGQWVEATKKCEYPTPGVALDWSDANNRGHMGNSDRLRKPGEIIEVCVQPKCKVHPKSYEKAAHSSNGREDEAARKAREEKCRLEALEECKQRMSLVSAAIASITALPAEAIRVLARRAMPNYGAGVKIVEAVVPGIKKVLQSSPVNSAEFARAVAVVSIEEVGVEHYQERTQGRDRFLESVRRLGYKGETPWDKPKAAPAKKAAKPAARKAAKKAAKKAGRK